MRAGPVVSGSIKWFVLCTVCIGTVVQWTTCCIWKGLDMDIRGGEVRHLSSITVISGRESRLYRSHSHRPGRPCGENIPRPHTTRGVYTTTWLYIYTYIIFDSKFQKRYWNFFKCLKFFMKLTMTRTN